jgi:hypothetical protein
MSRPNGEHQHDEHRGSRRRLRLVMDTNDADLSPEEIARLFEVAGMEQQTIAEMDACWEKLRASHRAKERLEHLTPSEVHDALAGSRHALGEDGER